ncbi:uncharacterized protein LOC132789375 [Drosophila nasuta]|uniref:uncharacterized protein LOC132789375 n=1 Tax=Drosophila nasuta TaxID=42062 RepID=UPI00295E4B53|nr:uncharacterized protein LOC132789375 [Drosophila nasuta]
MTQHWMLHAIHQKLCEINHCFIIWLTLKVLGLVLFLDYYYVYYRHDLLYWIDEISQHLLAYILSCIVLVMMLKLLSSVQVITTEALFNRNTHCIMRPRKLYEERYRRFVLMRLVQQLETALQQRNTIPNDIPHDLAMVEDLHLFHQQIDQAVNDFRNAVSVLLWPNRADLQCDASVLYAIDKAQLDDLVAQGYSLNKPESIDISNEHIKQLLNPVGY